MLFIMAYVSIKHKYLLRRKYGMLYKKNKV